MIYELNILYFVARFLPPLLRTATQIAWVRDLLEPLQTLNDEFSGTFVPDIRTKLKKTSITIVFEDFLTKQLGAAVTITTINVDPTNFYVGLTGPDPAQIALTGDRAVNFIGLTNTTNLVNFQVNVPTAVWNSKTPEQQEEFIALIEEIKYIGTNYEIVLV